MKQHTFEFCRKRKCKPMIEFSPDVTEKLVKHMAAAILEISRTRGGKSHEGVKTER
jgi:hypothetical protein